MSDGTLVQKLRAKLGELVEFLSAEDRGVDKESDEFDPAKEVKWKDRAVDVVGDPWIVLARAEGEDSIIPPKERLTTDDLRRMAESYDPTHRKAPIVLTHKGSESLGFIEEVEFDGANLLGRPSQVNLGGIGAVDKAVAQGWIQRSIRFWRNSPELPDRPPYLIHVALLAGEAPGQHSLPALDETFSRSLPEAEIFERSLLDEPSSLQEKEMDEQKIAELVGAAVRTAVQEATAPLTEKITGLEDRVAQAESTVKASNESSRTAALAGEVRQLVAEGRVMPAEKDSELEVLTALAPEKAEARLKALRGRPSFLRHATGQVTSDGVVLEEDRRFAAEGNSVDADKLRVLHEAERAAGGDFGKLRAALYAQAGEPLPGLPSVN